MESYRSQFRQAGDGKSNVSFAPKRLLAPAVYQAAIYQRAGRSLHLPVPMRNSSPGDAGRRAGTRRAPRRGPQRSAHGRPRAARPHHAARARQAAAGPGPAVPEGRGRSARQAARAHTAAARGAKGGHAMPGPGRSRWRRSPFLPSLRRAALPLRRSARGGLPPCARGCGEEPASCASPWVELGCAARGRGAAEGKRWGAASPFSARRVGSAAGRGAAVAVRVLPRRHLPPTRYMLAAMSALCALLPLPGRAGRGGSGSRGPPAPLSPPPCAGPPRPGTGHGAAPRGAAASGAARRGRG